MSIILKLKPEFTKVHDKTVQYVVCVENTFKNADQPADLNTIDTVLVLDKSGSMLGQPLDMLKEGSIVFTNDGSLTEKDRIGVFSFSNTVHKNCELKNIYELNAVKSSESLLSESAVVVDKATVNDHKQLIIDSIKSIVADGTTNIFEGLDQALEELKKLKASNIQNCILFSDGQHNCRSHHTTRTIIDKAKELNVIIHCIGSKGHDTDLMSKIAVETGGLYFSITDFEQITGAIAAIVDCQQTIICSDLSIDLSLANNAQFIKDQTICSFPFEFKDVLSEKFASKLSINIGRLCKNEIREFAITVKYSDDIPINDSIINTVNFTTIKSNLKKRQTTILPPVVTECSASDIESREYSSGFCKQMLDIIASSAMSKALKLDRVEAIKYLKSSIEQLSQIFIKYNGQVSDEQYKLIIQDIQASINDLQDNRIDAFNNSAISFSTQSPAIVCVTSERVTSMEANRSESNRIKTYDYDSCKQSLRRC